jgi:hypothetical protein
MVRLEREIPGVPLPLVERVVEQLLGLEPEATAVLLTGSYAKGTAAVASDLDLMAITPSPRTSYRMWFEEHHPDASLHISVGAKTAAAWQAGANSPARWSLGFPAVNDAVYLWTHPEESASLGDDPSLRHPAATPELEDFLDFVLKAKRSANGADELGLRWFAQAAASLVPALLIPLNEQRIVRDRRDALDAALSLAVAPDTYAADVPICLGLASSSSVEVKAATARLSLDLLSFLREHAPDIDQQPQIGKYLADGTLERRLRLID